MRRLLPVFLTLISLRVSAQGPNWIVDAARLGDSLPPVWASFGCDEPNYTYGPDGSKLLGELASLGPVTMRVHNLLTTGDGQPALKWGSTNAYTEDAAGQPVYDWTITDRIFDAFVHRGIRPIAEVGFMPEALSVHPEPYRHHWAPGKSYGDIFTGWAYPPRDYGKWAALVYAWVSHCVGRYGAAEVASWWWEVWNEPNIGYWRGSAAAYDSLYDYTADAVRRACPGARVGGPASTGPGWDKASAYLSAFLEHCHSGHNAATGAAGAPLDFVSFHAKGSPHIADGHVRMNMAPELKDVENGFRLVSGSAFASLPVLVTEFDPEGCAACSVATNPENAYRNGTMYSGYTAEAFARLYALAAFYHVNLAAATTWAFTFEGQPWFAGFRDLATNGVDKPVVNVFRMLARMRGRLAGTDSTAPVLATATPGSLHLMTWNYQADETSQDTLRAVLTILRVPAPIAHVREFRIDETHSNAYTAWLRMGAPQTPTAAQVAQLEQAGGLQAFGPVRTVPVRNGRLEWPVALPARAVSLLQIDYQTKIAYIQ
ncbi:GH39 family glycosyl hydrolase [Dinghuibacter silviterrae]|uniref:Xylan 1,4-beta-xylosidase n=1 Tax=Dinghuibacter silviterrae TaxID=1539049 RepID=A0A4R8DUW4_9BACT|nr:beta-xylosidase [Dinghuibacter silviterrae]TDX01708.1 xylan 1,4-beta-xylosidase [Dinghuibacter silviterrae]